MFYLSQQNRTEQGWVNRVIVIVSSPLLYRRRGVGSGRGRVHASCLTFPCWFLHKFAIHVMNSIDYLDLGLVCELVVPEIVAIAHPDRPVSLWKVLRHHHS